LRASRPEQVGRERAREEDRRKQSALPLLPRSGGTQSISDEEEIMTTTFMTPRFIALVAATLLAATAMAGDNKDKQHDMKSSAATFESLDKNADQQISKTEAAADKTLSNNFAAADTNGDGYLSKAEYMALTKS
jgi:hypothetical protein